MLYASLQRESHRDRESQLSPLQNICLGSYAFPVTKIFFFKEQKVVANI